MKRFLLTATLFFALMAAPCLHAQTSYADNRTNNIRAQHIVNQILAQHRKIGIAAIHAIKPGESTMKVWAINLPRIGKPSDPDDLETLATGKEQSHNLKAEGHYEVLSILHDKHGKSIGMINLVFFFSPGSDVDGAPLEIEAHHIRDSVQSHLNSVTDLFRPYDVGGGK